MNNNTPQSRQHTFEIAFAYGVRTTNLRSKLSEVAALAWCTSTARTFLSLTVLAGWLRDLVKAASVGAGGTEVPGVGRQ